MIIGSLAKIFSDELTPRQKTLGCLLWLVFLNAITFWQHYAGTVSFPGDFRGNYFPLTSFWTHLLQNGIFPHWMPFQNVGLPFLMTMQSGIFYPALWIFAIPGFFEYSLHAANIVQALHVLLGVVGFWVYARSLGLGRESALFGATAFHFFGGFYSNSDCADMVRAYAWLPWLFWTVHINNLQKALLLRNLLAPFFILMFVTGSYVGNLMSHGFFLFIFCVLSWLSLVCVTPTNFRLTTKLYVQLAGLCLLGLGLASMYLLPAITMKPLMDRGDGWFGTRFGWLWYYWNTLLMPTDFVAMFVQKTMVSAFVTVPVFCLMFMADKTFIKRQWLLIGMTVFAVAMAQGKHSFVFDTLTKTFSFLNYSRFPSSDYRGLLCFGIILLSTKILDECTSEIILVRVRRAVLWCCGLLAFYCLFWILQISLESISREALEGFASRHQKAAYTIYQVLDFISRTMLPGYLRDLFVALALSMVVFFMMYHARKNRKILLISLLTLQCLSGFYMLYSVPSYWQAKETEIILYQEMQINGKPSIVKAINNPLPSRPACRDENSWRGFLDGSIICVSPGSIISKPRQTVDSMPVLHDYLYREWQALSLPLNGKNTCDAEKTIAHGLQEKSVHQISYGLQDVVYAVNAPEDFCFVENEMSFPGWSAKVSTSGKIFVPFRYCEALRAWCLPKGEYHLMASYRTPKLWKALFLSLACLAIYIAIMIFWLRREQSSMSDQSKR